MTLHRYSKDEEPTTVEVNLREVYRAVAAKKQQYGTDLMLKNAAGQITRHKIVEPITEVLAACMAEEQ